MLFLFPAVVPAQDVQFLTPEVGDRRVTLRWNRAPSDIGSPGDRKRCKEICGSCCREPRFGGYQIWRSTTPDPAGMVLLRTYSVLDTTWHFSGDERIFVDPDSIIVRACGGIPGLGDQDCVPLDEENQSGTTGKATPPFNGFEYYYAVTWYESVIDTVGGVPRVQETEMQSRAEGIMDEPVQPTSTCSSTTPLLGRVTVVPNPYDPSDEFHRASFGSLNKVQFTNLPCPATVRVFTIAGDHVVTLENEQGRGSLDWDLKNGNGDDVVGGIYMFVVETRGASQRRSGHFVIIR
jgi:hypothetical protein